MKLPVTVDYKTYNLIDADGNRVGDLEKIAEIINAPMASFVKQKRYVLKNRKTNEYLTQSKYQNSKEFKRARLFLRTCDARNCLRRRYGKDDYDLVMIEVILGSP